MPIILSLRRLRSGGSWFKASLGKKVPKTPSLKINRIKWTAVVAQAVECLLCKSKTLSSNPSPAPKIKTLKKKILMGRRDKITRCCRASRKKFPVFLRTGSETNKQTNKQTANIPKL
jgi:hypothetical protein